MRARLIIVLYVVGECLYKTMTSGMCPKHYEQYLKYGHCLDDNPRTLKDPNEIRLHENYAEVVMYNSKNEEVAKSLIDLDDVDKINEYKWSLDGKGYVRTRGKKSISIHRIIMDCNDKDLVVDHINHNILDNRKENLRITSQSKNNMNKIIQSNNTSGFTGVYEQNGLWCVQIKINEKTIPVGSYNKFEDAVKVRKEAENKYFGEHSLFNSCEEIEGNLNKIEINTICKVELDSRLTYGVVIRIVDENICIMKAIDFNLITDKEFRVDIKKVKRIEYIK